MHSHPNNFLSGVYYLRTPAGADTINFHDPRPQTGVIRPPVQALTAENTDQVVVRVEDGTLLLFPAYLAHSVDANASTEERVTRITSPIMPVPSAIAGMMMNLMPSHAAVMLPVSRLWLM